MNTNYETGLKLLKETNEAGIEAVFQQLQDVAPHISRYIVEVIGLRFSSPVLTYQQRETIVIAALISLGDAPNQLKWHMNFGLKLGITPEEIIEIATHCIPFSGFPRALNAITIAKQLFADQHLQVVVDDQLSDSIGSRWQRGMAKLEAIDGPHGQEVVESLAGISEGLAQQIVEFAFGEVYSRTPLNDRQRQLVTLGALTAQGGCEPQLKVHIHASLRVGLTKEQVTEALLQCAPYTGFPKVLNAVQVAKNIFNSAEHG